MAFSSNHSPAHHWLPGLPAPKTTNSATTTPFTVSKAASAKAHNDTVPFFTLFPPEIRDMIYGYATPPFLYTTSTDIPCKAERQNGIVLPKPHGPITDPQPRVLQICSRLRQEAMVLSAHKIVYTDACPDLGDAVQDLELWLMAVDEGRRQSAQSVMIIMKHSKDHSALYVAQQAEGLILRYHLGPEKMTPLGNTIVFPFEQRVVDVLKKVFEKQYVLPSLEDCKERMESIDQSVFRQCSSVEDRDGRKQ